MRIDWKFPHSIYDVLDIGITQNVLFVEGRLSWCLDDNAPKLRLIPAR